MAEAMFSPVFWPADVIREDIVTPIEVLERVANELSVVSGSRFRGAIESETIAIGQEFGDETITRTAHSLEIHVPALQYAKVILWIEHAVDQVYPVMVYASDLSIHGESCSTQSELEDCLRRALQSDGAKSLIYSLSAQVSQKLRSTRVNASDEPAP